MLGSVEYKRAGIGVVAIALASSLMPFADDTTPLIPIPSPNFTAYLFVSWGYLLILPAVFALSYFWLGARSASRPLVFGVVTIVAALNAWWIAAHWTLGLAHPGAAFVRAVAIENAVAFAVVLGLALAGVLRRSSAASDYAYVGMFVVLGWCAFPLFGSFGS
jgi:hypothetical protein